MNGIDLNRGGQVVSAFPVEEEDQIMLVTNAGQSIRCPVSQVSRQSRAASGVRVFNTAEGEEVVSVARLADSGDEDDDDGEAGGRVDAPATDD